MLTLFAAKINTVYYVKVCTGMRLLLEFDLAGGGWGTQLA